MTKLMKQRLETLNEMRKAERKGAPFTIPGDPWHKGLCDLARLGLVAGASDDIRRKPVFWSLTPAGRFVLDAIKASR